MHYARLRRWGEVRPDVPRYQRRHKKPPKPRQRRPKGSPAPPCTVDNCTQPAVARKMCAKHYKRWEVHGDPLVDKSRRAGPCAIEGCENLAVARGWCHTHYKRWSKHGDPHRGYPPGWGKPRLNNQGYVVMRAPEHPNAWGNGDVAQHVYVMADVIGRPIRPGETVHHKNGVRHDNRPENLELWARRHPPGQRVSELIAFAHEILESYKDDPQLWPEYLAPP